MKNFITILLFSMLLVGGVYAQKVAIISKVSGDVLLQKAEDIDYNTPVTVGTILNNNDQIKVNDGFAVMLLLDDKSQVKMRENTEVAISMVDDLSGAGYHVRLDYGQALTNYSKGAGFDFQLHTPTSVASIKGTSFWTISDPEDGDQIIVLEGIVDVMNNLTGMISTAGAGQSVKSTTDGYIETGATEEGSIPEDPEESFGAAEEPEEEEVVAEADSTEAEPVVEQEAPEEEPAEETMVMGDVPPPPPSTTDQPAPEQPAEEPEAEEEGGGLFGDALAMDAAFGAVTIDGQLYNQIALRPDISIGKLGVGLDVVLYMNQDGDIRTDEWDDYTDVIDKIMYVRWGQPQDPLYLRVGTLEKVVMGYGLFVNGYNNMTEYPSVRKVGTHIGLTFGPFGIETMVANVKEQVGLASLRGTFSLGKLKFGATVATDANQYLGFKDADDDGVPDIVDDFPDDAAYALDSDNDGLPDEEDYDNDNDGKLEVGTDLNNDGIIDGTESLGGGLLFDNDGTYLKPAPFDLDEQPSSSLTGVSFDVGYPLFSNALIDLMVFAEAGQFLGEHDLYDSTGSVVGTRTHGWGLTAPGIRATIMKFVHLGLEYRMTGENFVFSMFDQNYDIDRVGMRSYGDLMIPITRDARLLNTDKSQGVFGSLAVDILSMVTVNGAYQYMMQEVGDPIQGIYGSIDLAGDLIPKVAGASAYINRMNVDDPFDIYNEGTLMGYKVVFEIGGGATLTWDFRQTYRDLDGNGEIDLESGSDEVITTTVIETGFSF